MLNFESRRRRGQKKGPTSHVTSPFRPLSVDFCNMNVTLLAVAVGIRNWRWRVRAETENARCGIRHSCCRSPHNRFCVQKSQSDWAPNGLSRRSARRSMAERFPAGGAEQDQASLGEIVDAQRRPIGTLCMSPARIGASWRRRRSVASAIIADAATDAVRRSTARVRRGRAANFDLQRFGGFGSCHSRREFAIVGADVRRRVSLDCVQDDRVHLARAPFGLESMRPAMVRVDVGRGYFAQPVERADLQYKPTAHHRRRGRSFDRRRARAYPVGHFN